MPYRRVLEAVPLAVVVSALDPNAICLPHFLAYAYGNVKDAFVELCELWFEMALVSEYQDGMRYQLLAYHLNL